MASEEPEGSPMRDAADIVDLALRAKPELIIYGVTCLQLRRRCVILLRPLGSYLTVAFLRDH